MVIMKTPILAIFCVAILLLGCGDNSAKQQAETQRHQEQQRQ